jgi:short-subunit dehydrogenase
MKPESLARLTLITGASRGLGKQIALACARRGYRLALVARDEPALRALAEELRGEHGTEVGVFGFDLARPGASLACVDAVSASMGAIDVLVNNAGIGWWRPFLEHTAEEHDRIIDLNLRAVVHLTHAVLPGMIKRGDGQIINIASDLATRPLGNMVVYTATKHAMRGFSRSLAQEVRPLGVKVAQLNPGLIDSSFGEWEEGSLDEADALKTAPLAELVLQLMEQPGHQMIDELEVHAMGQDY